MADIRKLAEELIAGTSDYAKQLEQQLNKDYGISPKHYGIQLQNKHRKKK